MPESAYQCRACRNNGSGGTHSTSRESSANPVAAYFLGTYDPALNTSGPSDRFKDLFRGHDPLRCVGVTNLGYLMKENLIESYAEIVYCPSNRSRGFSYEAYGGDNDWPHGLGSTSGTIRVSTSYLPQSRTKKHRAGGVMAPFPNQAYKYSDMNPSLSVVMDLLKGRNLAHKSGSYTGSNLLFGDGSVVFSRDDKNVLTDVDLIEAGNQGGHPEYWREAMLEPVRCS